MEKLLTIPATTSDVGELLSLLSLLSSELAQQKPDNWHCFMKVLTGLQYLARQGISIWGHDESESNLYQVLRLLNGNEVKVCSLTCKINSVAEWPVWSEAQFVYTGTAMDGEEIIKIHSSWMSKWIDQNYGQCYSTNDCLWYPEQWPFLHYVRRMHRCL